MKISRFVGVFVLFLTSGILSAQDLPASAYWDDIELIDGQVLRASIVDRVKDRAVIQLSTRDFISLPESSIRKVSPGLAKRAKSAPLPEVPAVAASVDVSLTTPPSPKQREEWSLRWKWIDVSSAVSAIFLTDGTRIDGVWVDTEAGYAVIVLPDGTATGVSRASIQRVGEFKLAEVSTPQAPAAIEPVVVDVDLLAPFIDGVVNSWNRLNDEPAGMDAAPFRTFVSPTAFTLKGGEFNVSQLALVGTEVTYGITDNVQIQAGTVLPALFLPDFGDLAQLGLQASFALPAPDGVRLRVSALSWQVWSFAAVDAGSGKKKLDFNRMGWLPAVLTTFSNGTWDATAGMGLWGRGESDPWMVTATASAIGRFAPHWALLVEGNSTRSTKKGDEDWYNAMWGIRFWNPFVTVDLGAAWSVRYFESPYADATSWSKPAVLPVLNLSFKP